MPNGQVIGVLEVIYRRKHRWSDTEKAQLDASARLIQWVLGAAYHPKEKRVEQLLH